MFLYYRKSSENLTSHISCTEQGDCLFQPPSKTSNLEFFFQCISDSKICPIFRWNMLLPDKLDLQDLTMIQGEFRTTVFVSERYPITHVIHITREKIRIASFLLRPVGYYLIYTRVISILTQKQSPPKNTDCNI